MSPDLRPGLYETLINEYYEKALNELRDLIISRKHLLTRPGEAFHFEEIEARKIILSMYRVQLRKIFRIVPGKNKHTISLSGVVSSAPIFLSMHEFFLLIEQIPPAVFSS